MFCNNDCKDRSIVTLRNGKIVCNYCPDWLFECEARHALKLQDKRQYLNNVAKKRGDAAAFALREEMLAIQKKGI